AAARGHCRDRRGADGHHAARDGRLRDHARDPQHARAALAADPRAHRQGDEGRPREVPRGWRLRLHRQARGGRPPGGAAPELAAAMSAAALPDALKAPGPPVDVLLVDDRADKLLALESILQDGDVRVTTARSGQEALRALLRAEFAVILLDVNMPLLDGFETA